MQITLVLMDLMSYLVPPRTADVKTFCPVDVSLFSEAVMLTGARLEEGATVMM